MQIKINPKIHPSLIIIPSLIGIFLTNYYFLGQISALLTIMAIILFGSTISMKHDTRQRKLYRGISYGLIFANIVITLNRLYNIIII